MNYGPEQVTLEHDGANSTQLQSVNHDQDMVILMTLDTSQVNKDTDVTSRRNDSTVSGVTIVREENGADANLDDGATAAGPDVTHIVSQLTEDGASHVMVHDRLTSQGHDVATQVHDTTSGNEALETIIILEMTTKKDNAEEPSFYVEEASIRLTGLNTKEALDHTREPAETGQSPQKVNTT